MSKSAEYCQISRVTSSTPNLSNITRGLADMAKSSFPGYPFEEVYDPNSLAGNIAIGEYRLIALLKPEFQQVIGTAVLGLSKDPHDPDRYMAEIKRVMTDKEHRGNGVAQDMTVELVLAAQENQVHPYTDTRADQRGMQKASHNAGLHAYTGEAGKHFVFNHLDEKDENIDLGPARETMIHMSSLNPSKDMLYHDLKQWNPALRRDLVQNLQNALEPVAKTPSVVQENFTSAKAVKLMVSANLDALSAYYEREFFSEDGNISVIKIGRTQMTIINPDASGFMQVDPSVTKEEIEYMLQFAEKIGLQIVTTYQNVGSTQIIEILSDASMEPGMIRPWQTGESEVQWQVGMRKTMNGFEKCLHKVNIDPIIWQELNDFIDDIKNNTN